MERQKSERFLAANREVEDFLRRAEGLASGTGTVTEQDLKAIWVRLENLAPEVGEFSCGETLAADLPAEIAKYVKNLKTLREALEGIRCVMLARRAQLEAAKRHINGLQSWVNAYQQTT
jgi:hypothetical protein